jgi:hypothetical protein
MPNWNGVWDKQKERKKVKTEITLAAVVFALKQGSRQLLYCLALR